MCRTYAKSAQVGQWLPARRCPLAALQFAPRQDLRQMVCKSHIGKPHIARARLRQDGHTIHPPRRPSLQAARWNQSGSPREARLKDRNPDACRRASPPHRLVSPETRSPRRLGPCPNERTTPPPRPSRRALHTPSPLPFWSHGNLLCKIRNCYTDSIPSLCLDRHRRTLKKLLDRFASARPRKHSPRRICAHDPKNRPLIAKFLVLLNSFPRVLAKSIHVRGRFLGTVSPMRATWPPQSPRSEAPSFDAVFAACEKLPRFRGRLAGDLRVPFCHWWHTAHPRQSASAGDPAKSARLAGQIPQSRSEARLPPIRSSRSSARQRRRPAPSWGPFQNRLCEPDQGCGQCRRDARPPAPNANITGSAGSPPDPDARHGVPDTSQTARQ